MPFTSTGEGLATHVSGVCFSCAMTASRLVGGLLLRELLRAAPEAFQAHAAAILPLAFGAKMDEDSSVAACWKEV